MQNYSITNHDLKFLPENVLLWSIDNQLCPTLSILEFLFLTISQKQLKQAQK